jgi:DNA-binding LytR/AlgR family response regulator
MQMKLACLIVDDEPIARQVVEKYCSYFPDLFVVASCGDALMAKEIMATRKVDIVFLDINMPVLDGLAFVKTLRTPPQVIFTTAYKEYAHEAFDIRACDYLLKPFTLDRFMQAVDKAKSEILKLETKSAVVPSSAVQELYIKSEGKIHKVNIDDVHYAEAQGNNIRIVTAQGAIVTTMTFTSFEEQLPVGQFVRVHRSFIINKSKIRVIEGNRVFIGSFEIPIGTSYRDTFFKSIGIG